MDESADEWDLFRPDPELVLALESTGRSGRSGRSVSGGVGADASPTPPEEEVVEGSFWLTSLEVILSEACSNL